MKEFEKSITWLTLFNGKTFHPLQWRRNGRYGVSNYQPHDCLLNRLFRRKSKKTPKLRVTGLCEGNSHVTGEFPAKRASTAENVSIWWRDLAHTVQMLLTYVGMCHIPTQYWYNLMADTKFICPLGADKVNVCQHMELKHIHLLKRSTLCVLIELRLLSDILTWIASDHQHTQYWSKRL